MAAPIQARISPGGTCMVATVASSTPPASPRQPACAAATTLPARSQSSTGRQSAVSTAHTCPISRVNDASAFRFASRPSSTTRALCTCVSQPGSAGNHSRRRARLAATLAGASPTWSPRLKLVQGAPLAPPSRVVIRLFTLGGAGQSGRIIGLRFPGGAVTQGAEQRGEIGRQGTLPLHVRPRDRMEQPQPFGVQRLARERNPVVAAAAGTIHLLADQRMADVLHVHPDLMGTPGFQLAAYQRHAGKALDHLVRRGSLLACVVYGALGPVEGVACQDRKSTRLNSSHQK